MLTSPDISPEPTAAEVAAFLRQVRDCVRRGYPEPEYSELMAYKRDLLGRIAAANNGRPVSA